MKPDRPACPIPATTLPARPFLKAERVDRLSPCPERGHPFYVDSNPAIAIRLGPVGKEDRVQTFVVSENDAVRLANAIINVMRSPAVPAAPVAGPDDPEPADGPDDDLLSPLA